jgi:NAD(P)-dependent dehydrogenase (short-subunit alcohol dehydrogenase family)
MDDKKVALITGCSSGIGLSTSVALARSGYTTYASMRDLSKSKLLQSILEKEKLPISIIQLDVTQDKSVTRAIKDIIGKSGRIDILVNNAGFGITGAFEDLTVDEIKQQFETNFFGLIRVTQGVLPYMRSQHSGVIVNISSGLGRFGVATNSAYASSKFAVEGLTESMSYELKQFGIRTVLIEPGIIRTKFIQSSKLARKSKDITSPYRNYMENMEKGMKKLIECGQAPEYVADIILSAIQDNNPKLRYLAGQDVEQILEAKEKLSDEDFHNMLKKMSS